MAIHGWAGMPEKTFRRFDWGEEADVCRDGDHAGECRYGSQEAGRKAESPDGRHAVADDAGIREGIPYGSAQRPQHGVSERPA